MLKSLNALRFVFAFLVFLSHLNYVIPSTNTFWTFCYRHIFSEGYVGVSFFFMLSGYILAYRYTTTIIEKRFSFKTFIRRRLARIVPMYYVGLLIALPLSYAEILDGDRVFYFKKLITNVFLLQSLIPVSDYYFSFNGVSWSVATELVFYFSFPILVRLLLRQDSLKKLIFFLAATLFIIATLFFNNSNAYYWLYISPYFRMADFTMGICLFLYLKNNPLKISKIKIPKWEYAVVGLFLVFFLLQTQVHLNYKMGLYYWIPIAAVIGVFALPNSQGKLSALLAHRLWQQLGHLSFSFYLLHHSFLKYYTIYVMHQIPSQWTGLAILLLFMFSILVSYSAYVKIEEPIRNYLRKRFTA